jgi:hypothetical protein
VPCAGGRPLQFVPRLCCPRAWESRGGGGGVGESDTSNAVSDVILCIDRKREETVNTTPLSGESGCGIGV